MSASVPWSVKGIDRKARETAKDLARRSGMTLGEWLNHVIEYQGEGKVTPLPANATLNEAIERLTQRIEAVETRSTLAVTGIDQSVRGLASRIDAERGLTPDAGDGPRVAEALKALETSIARIASQVYENEAAQKTSLGEVRDGLGRLTRRIDSVELGGGGQAADASLGVGGAIAERLEAMGQRLQQAEQRSSHAIERIGHEVLRMADTVTRQVQGVEARTEAAVGKIGGDVARISDQLESQLREADTAQAQALEKLGAEIERITQRLTERVSDAERRSAQAIDTLRAEADEDPFAVEPAFGLANRIRQSEERTAVLLEEARVVIDQRLAETEGQAPEPFDVEADTDFDPFGLIAEGNPFAAAEARLDAVSAEAAARSPVIYPDADPERSDYAFAPQDFQIVGAEPAAEPESETPFEIEDEVADDIEAFESVEIEAADPFAPSDPFAAEPFETAAEALAEDPFAEPADDDEFIVPRDETTETTTFAFGAAAYEAGEEAEAFDPGPFSRFQEPAAELLEPEPIENLFADETSDDVFVGEAEPGPEAPVSRMEYLERARDAARSAAHDKGDKRGRGGSPLDGFGLGAKRRGGAKLKNGLLMSTAVLVCLGAGMAGVAILPPMMKDEGPGKLAAKGAGKTVDLQPRAAMLTDPQPIAGKGTAPASAAVTPLVPTPAAAAAKPGAPDASLIYAESLSLLAVKDKRGMEMLRRAADLGYPQAELQLGHLYETGYPGLPRDLVEARKWTQRAAETGLPGAMHNLAMLIYNGEGGPKSETLAAQWFRQAADLGLADSQFNLGLLYENGKGVRANPAEAYKWFLLAGRGGDSTSRAEARAAAQRVRPLLSAEAQGAAERAAAAYGAPMQASR